MTDIVERLRDYDPTRANSREAAAEIERLTAALREKYVTDTELRAEVERLRAALQGALSMVDSFAFGAGLSTAGRAEYESYRRALEPKP